MKKIILLIFTVLSFQVSAQRYITKSGTISFYSKAPLETIEAKNNKVLSAYDTSTQAIVVKVLLKSFRFEKALMQEHFNENYVESDIFPNSIFKGTFVDLPNMKSTKNQNLKIKGVLKIHGIEKKINTKINFKILDDNNILVKGKLALNLSDYKIDIPSAVTNKIAPKLEVSYMFNLKSL